jgi:hypothetical protein
MIPNIFDWISKWMLEEKTPLWMILAYISFVIPIAALIFTIPTFGGLWYNLCMLTNQPSCSFGPNYMWVISNGLAACVYLDIFLFILAYISWKYDHYIPWLYRKFGRARRLRTEEL